MKKCVGFFLALMLLCGCIFSGIAPREVLAADAGYVAKDAPASVNAGYTPTQLQEGSFEHLPLDKLHKLTSTSGYIDAIYGLPWKTTDSVYEYVGNKYDVGYVNDYASENTPFGDVCVEMNATRDGVLYQDFAHQCEGYHILEPVSRAQKLTADAVDEREHRSTCGRAIRERSKSSEWSSLDAGFLDGHRRI